MVSTVKFSQFNSGGTLVGGDTTVGIAGGNNVKQTIAPQFVNDFTNSTQPTMPSAGTIGYNTEINSFQYWNGTAWQTIESSVAISFAVNQQIFTTSGTYTPTAGMLFCIVEMVGGGASGGGANGNTSQANVGGGGGAGEYASGLFTAVQIGSSQTITIGAGGANPGAAAGNNGGTTSLGSLMTALGGIGGGQTGTPSSTAVTNAGGTGGTGGTGGNLRIAGGAGSAGFTIAQTVGVSGIGGSSLLGLGGQNVSGVAVGGYNGSSGSGYGSGSSGGLVIDLYNAGTGSGKPGIVLITEFLVT